MYQLQAQLIAKNPKIVRHWTLDEFQSFVWDCRNAQDWFRSIHWPEGYSYCVGNFAYQRFAYGNLCKQGFIKQKEEVNHETTK